MTVLSQHEKARKGRALTLNAPVRTLALQHGTAISSQAKAWEDRLDSWKQIASYLGREVRTVQRWEKRECLPVHRHFHHKIGSVYAFKTELEQWRKDRSSGPDASASLGTEPSPFRSEPVLPGQPKNQLAILPRATHSSSRGKNGDLVQAIILVTPELQALPPEVQALHLGRLLRIAVPAKNRRGAGFEAVAVSNARQ